MTERLQNELYYVTGPSLTSPGEPPRTHWKFSYQIEVACRLVVEMKETNSILDRWLTSLLFQILRLVKSILLVGAKVDWDFRISDLVKTLMERMFNPCGEFRWSPEGSSPPCVCPGIFSDLLRSVQMIKREWGAESNGKLPHLLIPSKTAALVPEFAVEYLPSAELQPRFLRLQWMTCLSAETDDDDDLISYYQGPDSDDLIILEKWPKSWNYFN